MRVAVIKERQKYENRVAVSAETVKKLVDSGLEVFVESGAGSASQIADKDYTEAGAKVEKNPERVLENADIILKVQPPFEEIGGKPEYELFKKGATLISLLSPHENIKQIDKMARHQVSSFSMEFIPRISRAQSMDVLSSQSNLAGYKAVIEAVSYINKVVPLMMTAAGKITPANVLVLGAGVAGLQAIATAKRLGAVVSAFDVRPAVKEQVESLGATFIEVQSQEDAETSGGYAKEMSKEYQKKQGELLHETIKSQDIVITTALIPGKPAPVLITADMVKDMRAGSVIVDLAAIAGGNCALSEPDKIVTKHDVAIMGTTNLPVMVARDASALYAKNLLNFLMAILQREEDSEPKIVLDFKDELVLSTLVTHNGKIVHPNLSEPAVTTEKKKEPAPVKAPPKKVTERKPHLKKATAAKVPAKKPESKTSTGGKK